MSNINMEMPLVSIVIPVYNGADYLGEAIDSALKQSYSNCEILVVNDGSTDDGRTEQVALSYGDKIRYFSKENGKVSTALNLGIKEMRGEYFAWLSHDDLFYPDKIEKQVKVLQETGVHVAVASCNYFMDNGTLIPVELTKFYDKHYLETSVFPVIHGVIQFGGVLLHRCVFEKYGLFREDLFTTQDYEFLFRILRKEACVYTEDIVNGVRCHPQQDTNTSAYVEKEKDEMYAMFLSELTEEEQIKIYGSSYNFYYQILVRIMTLRNAEKSFSLCTGKLAKNEKIVEDKTEKNENIYIYGAGRRGKSFLFDLRCRGIGVQGFLDKNSGLKGTDIDGVTCYSLDEVNHLPCSRKIIIAGEYRDEMAKALQNRGITDYQYKEDYEQEHNMIQVAPAMDKVSYWIGKYIENGWK